MRQRDSERRGEREGPTELDGQSKRGEGDGKRTGFDGVRKVTEAERSFVFVFIKTCSYTVLFPASGNQRHESASIHLF